MQNIKQNINSLVEKIKKMNRWSQLAAVMLFLWVAILAYNLSFPAPVPERGWWSTDFTGVSGWQKVTSRATLALGGGRTLCENDLLGRRHYYVKVGESTFSWNQKRQMWVLNK